MRAGSRFWRVSEMTEGEVRFSTANAQHSAVSTASAGRKTMRFGTARRAARCSTG